MRESRNFWIAFALLCGAAALDLANPCVGVLALLHLALALAALLGYRTMRRRARTLRDGSPALSRERELGGAEGERLAREKIRRTISVMSRTYLGFCSILTICVTVATCLLTMLGLDPGHGGATMLPVRLAPLDAALDLWALSAVMSVAAAVLLTVAGGDVRRWLHSLP